MLNRASIPWNGKTLHSQMTKGNLVFDNPVQRGLVWDKKKQSLLLDTILNNYLIPPFVFVKKDGKYDCLDGKQRSHAIYNFIEGNYSLQGINPVTDDDGREHDFNGKCFNEIPEWAQDRIKEYSLSIAYYDEQITQEEIKEIFYRINNGKSLSSVQTVRAKARSFEAFRRLANTKLMQNCFTQSAKEAFNDELAVMQAYTMCFAEEPDFRAKFFRPFIETVDVTKEQEDRLTNAMALVQHVFITLRETDTEERELIKNLKKRTHLVCCIWLANYVWDKLTADEFATKVKSFYGTEITTSVSKEYNKSCESGSSTADAIKTRKEVLKKFVE